ncbi:MAG TPA: flagellar basal body P-ring formation chaperone FlgA [Deltaproteobacteria bacterium]|nr:flagellar basal body P-ring formation chaperone FlgA [Deltaproteobacteria bacterium]
MPAAYGGNTVDIKAESAFSGKSLKLSDVAEVSGPDAVLLSQIVLAESPGGASGLIMTKKTIEEKVSLKFKGEVSFTGAGSVHAVPCTVEVPEETLSKVFVDEILRSSPFKDKGTIEVHDIKISRLPLVLPADLRTIQAKFSSRDDFLGFTRATLSVGSGPSPEKVTVTGRVRLKADIPLVGTRVPSGRIVKRGDLVIKPFDISSCPAAYTKLEDCVGKRTKVTLRVGNPVQPSQVERMPDVCSGETVTIRARSECFTVEARGVAVKDGYVGEHIAVKNVSSGKQVVGTIIAPSVVQVEL